MQSSRENRFCLKVNGSAAWSSQAGMFSSTGCFLECRRSGWSAGSQTEQQGLQPHLSDDREKICKDLGPQGLHRASEIALSCPALKRSLKTVVIYLGVFPVLGCQMESLSTLLLIKTTEVGRRGQRTTQKCGGVHCHFVKQEDGVWLSAAGKSLKAPETAESTP